MRVFCVNNNNKGMAAACVGFDDVVQSLVGEVVDEYFNDRSTGNVWETADFACFVVDSLGGRFEDDDLYTRMCGAVARRMYYLLRDGARPAQIVESLTKCVLSFK